MVGAMCKGRTKSWKTHQLHWFFRRNEMVLFMTLVALGYQSTGSETEKSVISLCTYIEVSIYFRSMLPFAVAFYPGILKLL